MFIIITLMHLGSKCSDNKGDIVNNFAESTPQLFVL